MLPPSRYPRQRLLITLTLATGIPPALVQGLIAFTADDSWGSALIAASTLMLPPAIIAWGLVAGATRQTLGLVLAYASLFTLAGGALFGWLFWYGMAFLAASFGGRPAFVLIQLAAVAPYVILWFAAARTTKDLYGDAIVKETGPHLLSVALMYFVAFGLGSRFDFSVRSGERRAERAISDALRRSVFQVQACAIDYALAHPDAGYPRSLEAMGPSGEKCLDKRLAAGRPKGLLVEYVPEPPNVAGRIPSFVVRAREQRKRPASGEFQSAIGDTSGFVGETRGTASVTLTWRLDDGMIDEIAHLRTCALLVRAEHPEGGAAPSLAEMAARLGRFHRGDLREYLCSPGSVAHHARLAEHDSLGIRAGYRVSYTSIRDASGRPTDFEIVARPIAYGESGIRSYFVRSDGPIHVTLEDRAATSSDPVVPACAYGEKLNTLPRYGARAACARMPSMQPPRVALVHDSIATPGQPFTIALRDPTDRARPADPTYEHHLSCGTTPGSWTPPHSSATEIFRLGSELKCAVDIGPRLAYFLDTMHIMLYTRDRSGAIAKARSVVRLVAR